MIDYDAHSWRAHLFDIRGSMVRQISYRVLACVLWAAAVVAAHRYWRPSDIPDKAHALIGIALGLLLVFRTNASYDRFWEGRRQWGAIVNHSRNLGRQAVVLLAAAPDLRLAVVRWASVLPWAIMHLLRGERRVREEHLLDEREVARVLAAEHIPLAVTRRITDLVAEARARGVIGEITQMELDRTVALLVDAMGACERIHKTPLPFAYVVHLRRALIAYCFTLPMALVASFGWWSIGATLVIAYTLFGIEEIGVQIEDPFGLDDNDLPLERICANIAMNLRGLIAEDGGGGDDAKRGSADRMRGEDGR